MICPSREGIEDQPFVTGPPFVVLLASAFVLREISSLHPTLASTESVASRNFGGTPPEPFHGQASPVGVWSFLSSSSTRRAVKKTSGGPSTVVGISMYFVSFSVAINHRKSTTQHFQIMDRWWQTLSWCRQRDVLEVIQGVHE